LEKEEEVSIFDVDLSADEEKDKIKKMSQSATLETSDPERIIFEKILTGDKGDAVPSVFAYEKTPGKIFKLTPAKASSIYESFKQSGWGKSELNKIWKDEEFRDWISGYVLRAMSYTDNSENRKIVSKNYEDNAKLVWLSDEVIPEDVLNEMEISFSNSNKEIKGVLTDRKTMIGRSKWDSYQAPSAFDPFKNYR
jgi:hypothetical protein